MIFRSNVFYRRGTWISVTFGTVVESVYVFAASVERNSMQATSQSFDVNGRNKETMKGFALGTNDRYGAVCIIINCNHFSEFC